MSVSYLRYINFPDPREGLCPKLLLLWPERKLLFLGRWLGGGCFFPCLLIPEVDDTKYDLLHGNK